MIFKDALNKMIKDTNNTHASLAKMMNRATASFIGNIVIRNNTNINTLLEITDALGYEVIIKPKYGDNKAERTVKLEK